MKWGDDLSREHEKFLSDEYFKGPVFVVNWPKGMKPFYMRVNDDQKVTALASDSSLIMVKVGNYISL